MLDVCLDYYSTRNPFLDAVEEAGGEAARETVRAYFEAPRFRRHEQEEKEEEIPVEVIQQEVSLGVWARVRHPRRSNPPPSPKPKRWQPSCA